MTDWSGGGGYQQQLITSSMSPRMSSGSNSSDFNHSYLQHTLLQQSSSSPSSFANTNGSPLSTSIQIHSSSSSSSLIPSSCSPSFLHQPLSFSHHHQGNTPPSPITQQCLTGHNHYDPILLLHFLQEAKRLDPLALMNEAKENAIKKLEQNLLHESSSSSHHHRVGYSNSSNINSNSIIHWITITPQCSPRQMDGVCEVAELLMRYAHDNNKKWLLQTACVKSVLYGFEMDEVLHGLVWLVSEKIKSLNLNSRSSSGGSSTNNSPRLAIPFNVNKVTVKLENTNSECLSLKHDDDDDDINATRTSSEPPLLNSIEANSLNNNSNSSPGTPGTVKRKTPVKVVRVLSNDSLSPTTPPESASTIASKPQIVSAGSITRKGTAAARVVKRIQKQTDSPMSTPPTSPREEQHVHNEK
nr:unnamed protein product [Naegleria fowleri]